MVAVCVAGIASRTGVRHRAAAVMPLPTIRVVHVIGHIECEHGISELVGRHDRLGGGRVQPVVGNSGLLSRSAAVVAPV